MWNFFRNFKGVEGGLSAVQIRDKKDLDMWKFFRIFVYSNQLYIYESK